MIKTQNLTLPELISTLEIQNAQKADYVIPAKELRMQGDTSLYAVGTKGLIYQPNSVIHSHLSQKLNIPYAYYQRMQSTAPELLQANVNKWLNLYEDKKGLMLRTFESNGGNIARGLLSDRYGILDNYDVLFAALEAIKLSGVQVEIKEASITDKKMYVHIVAPETEVEATQALRNYMKTGDRSTVGDGIVSGLVITNSEVGFGSFEIRPRAVIIRCDNGLIVKDDRFRKIHLGAKLDEGSINWSEHTKQKNFELVISQTKDAVSEFLSAGYLQGIVQKIELASNQVLDNPVDTVQNVIKHVSTKVSIPDERKNSIMNYFITGGDSAASGVFQALTREAQNMNPDDRFEMETVAFEILPAIKGFDTVASKN